MTAINYNYEDVSGGKPIKAWTKGVFVEEHAKDQLRNIARLPFIHKHVAAMPDMHLGKGATVGSVIATHGAIVPAAVGVDIGCGMMAVKTTLTANELPDSLSQLRSRIEKLVPHGRTDNGGGNDRGAWGELPDTHAAYWESGDSDSLHAWYCQICAKHPKAFSRNAHRHLGTLGTGNHFIEICLDQNEDVWAMLHSGSRGAGNRIGMYFIEKAKTEMERYYIDTYLPDQDLSYLVENTEIFDDYVDAVSWAQTFAQYNRVLMMKETIRAMQELLPKFAVTETAINCHHNYVEKENHFGKNVWVTRKGAVRARKDDLGIIPGSMGTGSFIVQGKGSKESFCSCSHGAGRTMSRNQARKVITLEDHIAAMQGVECRLDEGVIDESPAAYKDINAVMAAQSDLVDIKYHLKQVLNVKG